MDEAILLTIREGIAFLKRREYNCACEKMARSQAALRESDVKARRKRIDEINRTLVTIKITCSELENQVKHINSIEPMLELSAVTELINELKQQKARMEVEKRQRTKNQY